MGEPRYDAFGRQIDYMGRVIPNQSLNAPSSTSIRQYSSLGSGTNNLGAAPDYSVGQDLNYSDVPTSTAGISEYDRQRLNQQQTMGNWSAGISAFSSLANAWQAYEANKLAKEQFGFQKEAFNTNLANQIKTYNTTLAGRREGSAGFRGESAQATADYIKKHSL